MRLVRVTGNAKVFVSALGFAAASRPTETISIGSVAVVHGLSGCDVVLSERQGFLFFAWKAEPLVRDIRRPPRLLPRMLFGVRTTRPLHGLIWPKDGCASIA